MKRIATSLIVLALSICQALASVTPTMPGLGLGQFGGGGGGGVLAYLISLTGTGKILSGQHTSYFNTNPLDNWTVLQSVAGQTPAIIGLTPSNGANGVNFSNESNPADGTYYAPIMANNALAAGNIVILNYWLGNPTNGVMINGDASVTARVNPDNDLTQMLVPGSTQNTRWIAAKATMISQIKSIHGTVIIRPFFEMEGTWFWWNGGAGAPYIAVWRDMVTSIRAATGNALFFWCSNGGGFSTYWPGASYVDIAGYDQYGNTVGATGDYTSITALGIPFVFGEVGVVNSNTPGPTPNTANNTTILASAKTNTPLAVAINTFCQNWSLSLQNGTSAYLNDSAIINLAGLPPGVLNLKPANDDRFYVARTGTDR